MEGKKKVLKQHKVLELNSDVADVSCLYEKNLLLVTSESGDVFAYNVDQTIGGVNILLFRISLCF